MSGRISEDGSCLTNAASTFSSTINALDPSLVDGMLVEGGGGVVTTSIGGGVGSAGWGGASSSSSSSSPSHASPSASSATGADLPIPPMTSALVLAPSAKRVTSYGSGSSGGGQVPITPTKPQYFYSTRSLLSSFSILLPQTLCYDS